MTARRLVSGTSPPAHNDIMYIIGFAWIRLMAAERMQTDSLEGAAAVLTVGP